MTAMRPNGAALTAASAPGSITPTIGVDFNAASSAGSATADAVLQATTKADLVLAQSAGALHGIARHRFGTLAAVRQSRVSPR